VQTRGEFVEIFAALTDRAAAPVIACAGLEVRGESLGADVKLDCGDDE
jgi:hypothetical protein